MLTGPVRLPRTRWWCQYATTEPLSVIEKDKASSTFDVPEVPELPLENPLSFNSLNASSSQMALDDSPPSHTPDDASSIEISGDIHNLVVQAGCCSLVSFLDSVSCLHGLACRRMNS